MTQRTGYLLAGAGSLALLMGAFAFEYIGGMAPCKLCIWQRWPHGGAMLAALLVLIIGPRAWIALLGAASVAISAGIGLYHVGVEQKWWEGPQGCTGFDISQLSPAELLDKINAAPLVRCDEIPWDLFGVSMAGWNFAISAGLCALWLWSVKRPA